MRISPSHLAFVFAGAGRRAARSLGLVAAIAVAATACKGNGAAKPPRQAPTGSTRGELPDLPFGPDAESRPASIPHGDEAPAPALREDEAQVRSKVVLGAPVADVDQARVALERTWPNLEISCWAMQGCFQRGDLDGDGESDAMVMVRERCESAPCEVGMVVFATGGQHLRLGAGIDPALPWTQRLAEPAPAPAAADQAPVQWTSGEEAKAGRDWRGTRALLVSPAHGASDCATALGLPHDLVVIEGEAGSGALLWRDGAWRLSSCAAI